MCIYIFFPGFFFFLTSFRDFFFFLYETRLPPNGHLQMHFSRINSVKKIEIALKAITHTHTHTHARTQNKET